MDLQKYFDDYDKERELAGSQQTIFDWMVEGCGWSETLGSQPGYFDLDPGKRSGDRLLWGCNWSTRKYGLLDPNQYLPPEQMTSRQLLAELRDVGYRGGLQAEQMNRLATDFLAGDISIVNGPDIWLRKAQEILSQSRLAYPEYCAFWSMPPANGPFGDLHRLIVRPGWGGTKEDYLRAALGSEEINLPARRVQANQGAPVVYPGEINLFPGGAKQ